jgi:hypothetical protein
MAMSARLSVTVITSVLTRLNAATATIKREDDEHHAFFKLHGGKPGAVLAASSRGSAGRRSGCPPVAAATSRAWCRSLSFRRTPVGPSSRKMRCRVFVVQHHQSRVVFVVARI